MLLDLICFDCLKAQLDKGVPHKTDGTPIQIPFEPVNNNGTYIVNCGLGHSSKTIINNIDFEILFEYSINAIADGYYREAVSSFASSMERYFEFFIKTILRVAKNEFTEIDKIWKSIASQSERQLGAYIILYSQTFSSEPLLLSSNKDVPFRNAVVHKGYLPTRTEAIDFGNVILSIIENSLLNLKNKYPEQTTETFNYYPLFLN